ncbi:hypothetical protein H9L12_10085 [Sphingomonas rhizophila]|uniref:Thymidylate synthase n=1 Tax=Sphingomonas rhizophila TaxID=2071607 RepID=A0A7G9S9V3_9SPHN|nr:hypothetical protein [Sphingomonas rhizophila]QNN64628.1 hypothetical protein H9L12_10085 [Sphingomonas rhizophila]
MRNSLALDDQPTVARSWLQAVTALENNGNRAYNLVYSVTEPFSLQPADKTVIREFNSFALAHGLHSTETVANTIFPLDTYLSQGPAAFSDYYLDAIYPKVKKQWGTYFERMVRRHNDDGSAMQKDGGLLNPLVRLVEKVKRRVEGNGKTTTHYELSLDEPSLDLATYDPHHDGAYQIGGPCLSHVSFKIDGSGELRLTAFYRSHWYIARALGNLIGLARLQAYVAKESGAPSGPMTIVASEAVLDLSGTGRSAAQTRAMLQTCKDALAAV